MHEVTVETLQTATLKDLERHIEALENDIGAMDFFFENFLAPMGPNEMGDHNTSTPEWLLYRKMRGLYEEVDDRLRTAKYYYSVG